MRVGKLAEILALPNRFFVCFPYISSPCDQIFNILVSTPNNFWMNLYCSRKTCPSFKIKSLKPFIHMMVTGLAQGWPFEQIMKNNCQCYLGSPKIRQHFSCWQPACTPLAYSQEAVSWMNLEIVDYWGTWLRIAKWGLGIEEWELRI
jgi:hypothetical protein